MSLNPGWTTLGKSVPCVGSQSKAPDDAGDQRSLPGSDDAEVHPRPFASDPPATISR